MYSVHGSFCKVNVLFLKIPTLLTWSRVSWFVASYRNILLACHAICPSQHVTQSLLKGLCDKPKYICSGGYPVWRLTSLSRFFLSNSPNEILETRKKIAYFKPFFVFAIWMVSNFSKYKIGLAVRIFVKLSQDGLVCGVSGWLGNIGPNI